VTGGTGRFSGATGLFTLSGQVNFNTLSFCPPFSRDDLNAVEIARRICVSQLAFVWLRRPDREATCLGSAGESEHDQRSGPDEARDGVNDKVFFGV
jgi:hypothetical protein